MQLFTMLMVASILVTSHTGGHFRRSNEILSTLKERDLVFLVGNKAKAAFPIRLKPIAISSLLLRTRNINAKSKPLSVSSQKALLMILTMEATNLMILTPMQVMPLEANA